MTEHRKRDMRKGSKDQKEERRRTAMRLKAEGHSQRYIASFLGVREATVSDWCKKYAEHGEAGLVEKKRGVPLGRGMLMKPEQEQWVVDSIVDTMPDQLKLPYGLWTRKAAQELIEREFGIEVSTSSMTNYFKRWGFTPQRPARVAYEQRPAQVEKWLEETYPNIKARAKNEDAEIHFGDEVGIRNNCQSGRSFAPRGKTPFRKSMSKKFSINMASTVTNSGKVSFMIYRGKMDTDMFIKFLIHLLKGRKKKVFLIVDNLVVHHAKKVKAWVAERSDRIELFYLPSYSPQLNPDEYLNGLLKNGLGKLKAPKDRDTLDSQVRNEMTSIKKKPRLVKSFFQHELIRYAA